MSEYQHIKIPQDGEKIRVVNNKLKVPSNPIIAFIEGDGTGPDIWRASKKVFEAAVEKAFNGKKKISWMENYAGTPNPMKKPQNMDIVIFRENTEDVYSGIEFKSDSEDANKLIDFINQSFNKKIRKT